MSSIAEWLQQQGPEDVQHQGVTTLDLADLPLILRVVARLILRDTEMNYATLCNVVTALPDGERISQGELDEALAALSRQRWLVCTSEGHALAYKINLRRRAGRVMSRSAWAALEDD